MKAKEGAAPYGTFPGTPVWLVRAGGVGEDEDLALSNGRAIIGFRDAKDLATYTDVVAVAKDLAGKDSQHSQNRAATRARQLWAFRSIANGDTIVLPLKTRPGQLAIGVASGTYRLEKINGEMRHAVPVKWVKPDLPRTTFQQDLLYSLGAFLTVCRIKRNDAEARVAAVLKGMDDPGWPGDSSVNGDATTLEPIDAAAVLNLAQASHDEIVAAVRKRFQGHDMARLVAAILEADGYLTQVSPPGPDGGVDILAGRGPLGIDGPNLCVQVKATEKASDVRVFRELVGTMESLKASQGLLVCWSGFTGPMHLEARQHAFRIKLWDQSQLVDAIYRTYERLSPEVQTELPLKRVWTLVREDVAED